MITRFAPSPTGPLHLGHAFAAITAHDMTKDAGGTFLLRIEDLDQTRARAEWEAQITDDLKWLGLTWPEPVMRQSERRATHDAALQRLWDMDLLYPCTCNRRDIIEAAQAPQEGVPLLGPDGIVYPGTCRNLRKPSKRPQNMPLRIDLQKALEGLGESSFSETGTKPGIYRLDPATMPQSIGDVALARRDMGSSYHLAVVMDDAAQGITHVTRGDDLLTATCIHLVLQRILSLPTPVYHHHRLIRDETGRRLAKREDARAIARYRDEGQSPSDIRQMIGL